MGKRCIVAEHDPIEIILGACGGSHQISDKSSYDLVEAFADAHGEGLSDSGDRARQNMIHEMQLLNVRVSVM
jgi:hypothetical protein